MKRRDDKREEKTREKSREEQRKRQRRDKEEKEIERREEKRRAEKRNRREIKQYLCSHKNPAKLAQMILQHKIIEFFFFKNKEISLNYNTNKVDLNINLAQKSNNKLSLLSAKSYIYTQVITTTWLPR